MGTERAEVEYFDERQRMVAEQLIERDINDGRVLQAMRSVLRHRFVPPEYQNQAYSDRPLPIGNGQTISQPYIVALMTQLLELRGDETVLEVGAGSGYQAAILGCLAQTVHTVERYLDLARQAEQVLRELSYINVQVHIGDGSLGLSEFAPYQAIIVTAAAPAVSDELLHQLADGGRLVIPVGGQMGQNLECWQRRGDGFDKEVVTPVAFVPLRGQRGWDNTAWLHSSR